MRALALLLLLHGVGAEFEPCTGGNCGLDALTYCATAPTSSFQYHSNYLSLINYTYSSETGFLMNFAYPTEHTAYVHEGARELANNDCVACPYHLDPVRTLA
jgi:hypothetical protein